jgi:prolyl oligopeptidase
MKKLFVVLCAVGCANPAPPPPAAPPAAAAAKPAETPRIRYPTSKRGDVVDEYHGVKVPDPFRCLEELDSAETRAWIDSQVAFTNGFLEKLSGRERARKRLTELWNYERYSVPFKKGSRYFYQHNTGLQSQPALYTMTSPDAKPTLLFDPNTLSADGTVALSGMGFSHDGKLMAYGLQTSGSDWVEWHVRDVATGKDLPDVLKWTKFTGASFTHDGKGFFYSAYDPPKAGEELKAQNKWQKLYYHRLGQPQEKDELVYQRKDQPEWGFAGNVSDDGKYLVVHVWHGTQNENLLYVKDLAKKNAKVEELVTTWESRARFVGNLGGRFFLQTDKKAPRGNVVAVDLRDPKHEW